MEILTIIACILFMVYHFTAENPYIEIAKNMEKHKKKLIKKSSVGEKDYPKK